MSSSTLRLGTRRSALALAQSGHVAADLEALHPGLKVELVPILTRGDQLKGDLAQFGGKGLFTEELEQRLLEGSLDLAVHSLKDLPVRLPEGLRIAAHPKRADPRDVLISDVGTCLEELPEGATLLTGSLRRRSQILHLRGDLRVESIRGNIDTRLRKWRESGHAGIVLAAAGLARLGLEEPPASALDPEIMVPAPGQGILALEVAAGSSAEPLCQALSHGPSVAEAEAERALVTAFGGDCTLPLAAWARHEEGTGTHLVGVLGSPDGQRLARGQGSGESPARAAEACLEQMRQAGADEILESIRPS